MVTLLSFALPVSLSLSIFLVLEKVKKPLLIKMQGEFVKDVWFLSTLANKNEMMIVFYGASKRIYFLLATAKWV